MAGVGLAGCSKDAQGYLKAGNEYYAKEKYREAIVEYRNAVQRDPALAEARLKLGEALLKVGDGGRALGEFVRAADLLPNDASVQVKAGTLLLLARQFDDAKVRADKALKVEPQRAEAHVLRANALAGLSDFEGAIAQMQQALAIENRAGFYANLGALQLARGKSD
jgi:tetratricopeptide (TPR) repeat protein